jgi:predicted metal-dependent enzyme (double-stranded beta helix superfamily)
MQMEKLEKIYGLSKFVEEMKQVIATTTADAERVVKAEGLLGKLVRSKEWLPQEKLRASKSEYSRHRLYLDPDSQFEVLALIWKPGQRTPLHDHDGTWGVEGVISGRMKVINYVQMEPFSKDKIKLCYAGAMTVNEQSTGELLPPADCHILEADGEEDVTITIHVYGKQLRKFRVFDRLGEENVYSIRE